MNVNFLRTYAHVATACQHTQCARPLQPAQIDRCGKNPGWNIVNCPRMCGGCHLRTYPVRCDRALLKTEKQGVKPGDVDATFKRIIEDWKPEV